MTMNRFRPVLFVLPVLLLGLLSGCQSAYFATMEKFGVHKRDILVERVEQARESQQQAKEQFQSALEAFSALTGFDGGELERRYKTLRDQLQASEEQAAQVRERIVAVEQVAAALFDEWQEELDQYKSASLRRSSEQQLRDTRNRCDLLVRSMRRAEQHIEPVLEPLRDQVLYLKHNLNARAVAALRNELDGIQTDVRRLVRELEQAVDEADRFIRQMEPAGQAAKQS